MPIYQVYGDESKHSEGRFRSISIIVGEKIILDNLRADLIKILNGARCNEVKWTGIKTHIPKIQASYGFVKTLFNYLGRVNVSVIIWDTHDSRHKIIGRDDIENFHIMYYRIIKDTVCRLRGNIDWEFYPDKQNMVDWREIIEYLNNVNISQQDHSYYPLLNTSDYNLNFVKIRQQDSEEEPLVQLCDIFAGMGRFSREKKDKIAKWKDVPDNQMTLFEFNNDLELSNSEESRIEFIYDFYNRCKREKLGVSLKTNNYLNTREPDNPINFWNYTPQHNKDKAPTK